MDSEQKQEITASQTGRESGIDINMNEIFFTFGLTVS